MILSRRSVLCAATAGLLVPRETMAWVHGNKVPGNFTINLSYDTSTNSAPAGFKPAMDAAAAYLGSLIYNGGSISRRPTLAPAATLMTDEAVMGL